MLYSSLRFARAIYFGSEEQKKKIFFLFVLLSLNRIFAKIKENRNTLNMKVEEPISVYQSANTAVNLRGMIIDKVERETDVRVLHRMYALIEQLDSEKETTRRKIVVSPRIKALSSVPASDDDADYKNKFVSITEEKYV